MPSPPAGAPSMQEAILALTSYWAARGAAVMTPVNTEVGAGTLNPATFLRVLGPEPWRVAYVEPSVRPDDSRYGENPNRMQTHTQFQVILKPDPGDSQDLYLGSLAAIGIDLAAHDVRFVEDNWASPALGAWGLGWEVWMDGLEITQFTYFQQAGGFSLEPVSVEITYGLERILMALQDVRHFKQIAYAPGLSFGDVFGQGEYEWSRYYLDDADVAAVTSLFEIYEREAVHLIDERLPVPAYSYVLKCSHAFNILDSRGAVSPTERARSFARMRRLAHQVSELWRARREEEGYPLGVARTPEPPPADTSGVAPAGDAPLAFEIGVEELPAADVATSADRVRRALEAGLAATRLRHGEVWVAATPRRIVAVVDRVAPAEDDRDEVVRGPRRSAAFDAEGRPTSAAEGFARSQGVDVGDLQVVEAKGTEHVAVERHVPGRGAVDVLAGVLGAVVSDLRSPDQNMRWNAPGLSFVRPIRWVVALLGPAVVPFQVANLASGRVTRVHRSDPRPERAVADAGALLDTLAEAGIVVDEHARRRAVGEQATALAAEVELEPGLLDEVANLVEEPNALLGRFDPDYLGLPSEVLVTVMAKHQRYFPLRAPDGALLPAFVAVANGPCDRDRVRAGNESVLRARYEDARFFFAEDLRRRPEDLRAELGRLVFADRLGSMGDRAGRVGEIALALAGPERDPTLERAAQLVKFDLASQMVAELTSLAGIMAREYARRAGEGDDVAEALFEQELPRHSTDGLPAGRSGALLSVANRADLLAGLFATGAEPTGSSDPYGLRRAALGLLAVLERHPDLGIAVDRALDVAGGVQPVPWTDDVRDRALEFIARRWETLQLERGRPVEPVRAVLPRVAHPADADAALAWLCAHRHDAEFSRVAQALSRAARIVPTGTSAGWDEAAPAEPAEVALRRAVVDWRRELGGGAGRPPPLPEFVTASARLVDPVDRFFDDVLVMVDDPVARANRLGVLATIGDVAQGVIDWTALD